MTSNSPTVVNLDLYKLCEERVGPDSFLADLQSILLVAKFVPGNYIPFGVGTYVEVKYSGKFGWTKGIIIKDSGARTYSIYFTDGKTVEWTLNKDGSATGSGGKPPWRDAIWTSQKDVDNAVAEAEDAIQKRDEKKQKIVNLNLINYPATSGRQRIPPIEKNKQDSAMAEADAVVVAASAAVERAQTTKKFEDSFKSFVQNEFRVNKVTIKIINSNASNLYEFLDQNKFIGRDDIIFYGLFRILMACDVIHDFLGTRGFIKCEEFIGDSINAEQIKLAFRIGIVDAVIASFVSFFDTLRLLADDPPLIYANVLLHVCLELIFAKINNTLDYSITFKQNLMEILSSDAGAIKISSAIITVIGLRKVSGNIQRNDYKTGFTTIVDTHEAIDSLYADQYKYPPTLPPQVPQRPQYWEGDIECRVDAIGSPNHFIPVIIGLWNSANITSKNNLIKLDPGSNIEKAISTWAENPVLQATANIGPIRDVYSTFRKINIKRDISTNFDASWVDSLTNTSKRLKGVSKYENEYKETKFIIKCGMVEVLKCSLKSETDVEYDTRMAGLAISAVSSKKYSKFKKITLNVENYFGAIPSSAGSSTGAGSSTATPGDFFSVNDYGQVMGVNKIANQMCKSQDNIVQQSWAKTLGDFLQIMTYLHIGKTSTTTPSAASSSTPKKAKMFITLDTIASNIASLFDRFVFLEDISKIKFVADGADDEQVVINNDDADDPMTDAQVSVPQPLLTPTELFERTYGGTYIHIPTKMMSPLKMERVQIINECQIKNAQESLSARYEPPSGRYNKRARPSEFGTISKFNFGKKIKAAIVQARAYLKKYPFRKKTINTLPVNELRTKLNSVGIKTYVLKSGKKVNLSLRQLQYAAISFKKLQISCKNAGIKLMYNRNGKYYYKSYSRLVKESRKSGKIGKSGKSRKSNKINAMDVNELRTRLNSVGIKTYVLKSGKKVNLPLIQLQRAANYFKKLQIRCKNAGIKLMYKRNGKYYYKSYTRLMSETKRNKFG